jgi:iron complex transport system permease protein
MRRLTRRRLAGVLGSLSALLLLAIVVALGTGPSVVAMPDLIRILLADGQNEVDPALRDIVLRVRLPRVLLGGLVGAGLASAGAVFQALSPSAGAL